MELDLFSYVLKCFQLLQCNRLIFKRKGVYLIYLGEFVESRDFIIEIYLFVVELEWVWVFYLVW